MWDKGEFDYFLNKPEIEQSRLIFKDSNLDEARKFLSEIRRRLEDLDDWNREEIKERIWEWSGEIGRGKVLHPMRMALSGKDRSPDPFVISENIGKDETLERLSILE